MTKLKYKVGDKVRIKSLDWYNENKDEDGNIILINCTNSSYNFIEKMRGLCGKVVTISSVYMYSYNMVEDNCEYFWTDEMIEGLVEEEEVKDMGEVSDGYHTFNELYEYRLLYNASMFNELAKQNLYDVHKSKRHSDGEVPFGDSNWFIVMAELPTGQISNHYEMKDWDLFQIPEKEKANIWDGHTPKDVAERLRKFLTPQPKYPQTYEECCKIIGIDEYDLVQDYRVGKIRNIQSERIEKLNILNKLLICRDAYWKMAGEEMGLGNPWEPKWEIDNVKYSILVVANEIRFGDNEVIQRLLVFPTEEMRDAFYKAFEKEIEACKELI